MVNGWDQADVRPDRSREVVADWLAARYAGRAMVVTPLSGDASTRRYFRASLASGTTVAVLYPEPFDACSLPFLAVGSLLRSWGLPVPEVVAVDGERGIVLLEDLGDVLLQERVSVASAAGIRALYHEAVEGLILMQRASALSPRDATCFGLAFDEEKLSSELEFFRTHFLGGLRGVSLDEAEAVDLGKGFRALSQQIAAWPRVLCHRDYHSRNLMVRGERLFWIDFQDARMGPPQYDLASLLRDSYVDLDEGLVLDLLAEFRERAWPEETLAEFRRRFDLVSLQRNLKALGTFGFMATVRGKSLYLDFVPRTLARVRRNLQRHVPLQPIRDILSRHIPELST